MHAVSFSPSTDDGTSIDLAEILGAIKPSSLLWSILRFEGIGKAPGGLSMSDFEALLINSPNGLLLSWNEVGLFVNGVQAVWDILLVGVSEASQIDKQLRIQAEIQDMSIPPFFRQV